MTSIGRYSLEARLAAGGMAEVHLARLEGPGGFSKKYVIKTMLPHLCDDPQFVEMFLSEARLAALFNHRNVVQIYDFGEDRRRFYIAMEYVEGATLRALIALARRTERVLPPMMVAEAVAQACEGLAYVHELRDEQGRPLGLLHRDLSPENVILSTEGVAKLLDFGIAKAAHGTGPKTTAGATKGKLAYMSPEQVRGLPLDPRADVYSMGVTLYELLALRRPLSGENELELALSVLERTPPPLEEVAPHVPPRLAALVARAMHRDRAQRVQSARELQAALEAISKADGHDSTSELRAWSAEALAQRAHHPPSLETRVDAPSQATTTPELPTVLERKRPPPKRRGPWVGLALAGALAAGGVVATRPGRQPMPDERPAVDVTPPPVVVSAPPAPAPPVDPAPSPTPPEAATVTPPPVLPRAESPRRPSTAVGWLSVRSNPWCQVSLDGEPIGPTPVLEHKLRAGKHQLLLTNDKLGARRGLTITIAPGKTNEQAVVFTMGAVKVLASAGTKIFRGSELLGVAPAAELELVAGRHALGFILADSKKLLTRTVIVEAGKTSTVTVP